MSRRATEHVKKAGNGSTTWRERPMASLDIIFLSLGMAVMLVALILGRSQGNRPVEFDVKKGEFKFNADRFTLFFILGFLMVGSVAFFRYRGYESQVTELQKQLVTVNQHVGRLTGELQSFKN
jgi:hypothetical protein